MARGIKTKIKTKTNKARTAKAESKKQDKVFLALGSEAQPSRVLNKKHLLR
jgi:hypothetical protein